MRRALEAEKYDTISGDTAAIFSLNHSCLFIIANVMSSIYDRSFFTQISKIAKIHGILCVTRFIAVLQSACFPCTVGATFVHGRPIFEGPYTVGAVFVHGDILEADRPTGPAGPHRLF